MASPRSAAWLGEVRSPMSSAIFSELASIAPPGRAGPPWPRPGACGPEVLAMHLDEPLDGHRAEPDEERHVRVGLVVRQPLQGVDVGLLQDVGRRDPAPQPGIEPELDHPAQAIAVGVKVDVRASASPLRKKSTVSSMSSRFVRHGDLVPARGPWPEIRLYGPGPGIDQAGPDLAAPPARWQSFDRPPPGKAASIFLL